MIDYRIHVAALDSFREQLALTAFGDPAVDALRDEHVTEADLAPVFANLGSIVDLLIWHASSDGFEIDLLQRAAELWQTGLDLYQTLGEFRTQLETLMANPADAAALAGLNAAAVKIQPLAHSALDLDAKVQALRKDVVRFEHLQPHPRQRDQPLIDWGWSDIFLARRTEAFAREVRRQVSSKTTSAFATGVLSSYGANAVGNAFVTLVVGGPRRSHRFRNRLARNTMGAWVTENDASVPTLTQLADQFEVAFANSLPSEIEDLILHAMGATFDPGQVPPPPDLQLGYQRLLRHLRLLDAFPFPDMPALPREPFLTTLFGDPASTYTPSMPEGTGLVEAGDPNAQPGSNPGSIVPQSFGNGDPSGPPEEPDSTEVKCGAFWEALGWSLLFLLGGWFACVIRWADKDRCPLWDDITQNWEQAFPDGAQGSVEFSSSSGQALTADDAANIAQVDQIVQLIGDLYNLQSMTWEGFQKANDFLALYGLIYPTGLLNRKRYSQFLTVPSTEPGTFPLLPDDGSRFHLFPTTAVEQPACFNIAFPVGATPAAVLARVPQVGLTSAADQSLFVWNQIANDVQDSSNLDLDADREWQHACWRADGSITDQPIAVSVLMYSET
jgi:hypothetical protein